MKKRVKNVQCVCNTDPESQNNKRLTLNHHQTIQLDYRILLIVYNRFEEKTFAFFSYKIFSEVEIAKIFTVFTNNISSN